MDDLCKIDKNYESSDDECSSVVTIAEKKYIETIKSRSKSIGTQNRKPKVKRKFLNLSSSENLKAQTTTVNENDKSITILNSDSSNDSDCCLIEK